MRALLIAVVLLGASAVATLIVSRHIPPQHWPFAPLDLKQPVGLATSAKLASLRDDPGQCRAVLDRSALEITSTDDRGEGGFCRLHNAVAIEKSTMRYSAPVRVSCPMAAALYLWNGTWWRRPPPAISAPR
jgi:hypothetical protein